MSSVQIALAAEVERLRAELELHKGALIAEQEHVETLESELAACREAFNRYGGHDETCNTRPNGINGDCVCGYLLEVKARKGEGE